MTAAGVRHRKPRDLLVVSHPCAQPVHQALNLRLRDTSWPPTVVVPDVWRHRFAGSASRPQPLTDMEDGLLLRELRKDPDLRRALLERGRSRVEDLFSADARAEALHETLAAVVGSGQPAGGRDV